MLVKFARRPPITEVSVNDPAAHDGFTICIVTG